MARANKELINALRAAAVKIKNSDKYQWGHMGYCNCGFVAQELTQKTAAEIHQLAMQRSGDWNDQCIDYCKGTHMPLDDIISELLRHGLMIEDLMALENLSDKEILRLLPAEKRYLSKNNKSDVVLYLDTMANYLESELLLKSQLSLKEEQVMGA